MAQLHFHTLRVSQFDFQYDSELAIPKLAYNRLEKGGLYENSARSHRSYRVDHWIRRLLGKRLPDAAHHLHRPLRSRRFERRALESLDRAHVKNSRPAYRCRE